MHRMERRRQSLALRLAPCSPQGRFLMERSRTSSDFKLLRMRVREGVARRRQALDALEARLLSLDFKTILGRGYAMVLADSGKPVSSAGAIKAGEAVRIVFSDGMVFARVTDAVYEAPLSEEKARGAS